MTLSAARNPARVMLVRPPDPLQDASLLSHTKPMNLAYLAAYLRRAGHAVALADFEIEPYSDERFRDRLRSFQPQIVGLSSVTPTIRNAARIAAAAKTFDPGIATVVGGPHANGMPEGTLREFPAFDLLAYGEGEETLAELCGRAVADGGLRDIRGLAWRDQGAVVVNQPRNLISDIDSIPFPARDLIRYDPQTGHSSRGFSNRVLSTELFTSRGCPYPCTFCAIRTTFGETVRFRGLEAIQEEVASFMRDFRFDHVVIADDTFTLRPDRAEEICAILERQGVPSWSCDTRVTHVSRRLLRAMKRSGCRKVAFGVESGSPAVLDRIRKRITIEQVREAVALAREAGIEHIEGNFIIGSDPDETREDVALTERLVRELPWTFVSVSIIVPFPGTPVRAAMEARGLIDAGASWEDYEMFGTPPRWRTVNFSAADLVRMQRSITRKFYLRPSYILRQLRSIRTWADVRYWLSAGTTYLRWYLTGKI